MDFLTVALRAVESKKTHAYRQNTRELDLYEKTFTALKKKTQPN